MSVRTTKLAVGIGTGLGQHLVFTAPAGKVTLVKSVAVFNNSGGAGQYSIGALDVTSGNRVDWGGRYMANPLAAQESETVLGWWALMPGDELFVEVIAGGPLQVWVSGAELS